MIVIAAMLVALWGAGVATAQTVASLKIISGDGQVVCLCESSLLQFFQPITVQALDASGHGVANATITWTVQPGGFATVGPTAQTSGSSTTTTTDSNGIGTTPVYQSVLAITGTFTSNYLQSTIVAAANSGNPSAAFYETYSLIDALHGNAMVFAEPPTMNGQSLSGATLSGNSGSTLPAIQVFVGGEDLAADGVTGVSVALLLAPGQTSPTITCAPSSSTGNPGAVLSGAQTSGTPPVNVNCTPVLGGSGTLSLALDGRALGTINVSGIPRLYTLVSGPSEQTGLLVLTASPAVEAYDFTFG